MRPARRPANDDFAQATILSGAGFVFAAHLREATTEAGEPDYSRFERPFNSVWYSWTAPAGGNFTLRATNDYSVRMTIYSGDTLTNLTLVNSSPYQAVDFRAQAGEKFFFSIDDGGDGRDYRIELSYYPPPPNDDFANAILLTGTNVSISGTNLGASAEVEEPLNRYTPAYRSIWYAWTAPMDGRATFRVEGDFFLRWEPWQSLTFGF